MSYAEEKATAVLLSCWLCFPPLTVLHLPSWIDLLTNTN